MSNQQLAWLLGQTQAASFGDDRAQLARGWARLGSADEFLSTEFSQRFLEPHSEMSENPLAFPRKPSRVSE